MTTSAEQAAPTAQERTCSILHELGIAVHRHGYVQLCIAIPRFAQDYTQNLEKELYPYISDQLGYTGGQAVERAIRGVIYDAWAKRNPEAWNRYFPNSGKKPSNKLFIATLAELLR